MFIQLDSDSDVNIIRLLNLTVTRMLKNTLTKLDSDKDVNIIRLIDLTVTRMLI